MSFQSTIHVLDKSDYSKHQLVTLPSTNLPPLAPSSLRLRPRILGLTTNNLTYARHGHLMGWYDIYPLPPNTPAPYNDSEIYGRVAAWGYADIVESTVPDISAGQTVYGFHPISTGIETVHISFATHADQKIKDQIIVLDPHRQHLWKIYNRYQICPSSAQLEDSKGLDSLGWDALMQGLFATGYNLSTFGFAWEDGNRIHPSGNGEWSEEDANLKDAAVIVLNASGKTAQAFAHALIYNRPNESQPKITIGVGSEKSLSTISSSNLYDAVWSNSDHDAVKAMLESAQPSRIVLLDFGAREDVPDAFSAACNSAGMPFTRITIGGEVKIQSPETAAKRLAMLGKTVLVNASLLREKGIEVGGSAYFDEFYAAWEVFKRSVKGMRLDWGKGMEGWESGWEALCRDEVRASRGLVYRI